MSKNKIKKQQNQAADVVVRTVKDSMTSFEYICSMSQQELKEYLTEALNITHKGFVFSGDGYVYAQGDFPVLLVAHMDTVHTTEPTVFVYEENGDKVSSPTGIGGDDRCGIYMVLRILQEFNCSVVFTEDEEIGCVGADKFSRQGWVGDLEFNYIVEFDRKGKTDAVFYECANDEFSNFIEGFGHFKSDGGSFTDICAIAPVIGCAAVNLSCGYYNAHTTNEYVRLSEMEENIRHAMDILEGTKETDAFKYVEAQRFYRDRFGWDDYGFNNYTRSNSYLDEIYYLIEYIDNEDNEGYYDTYAVSEAEAVGEFLMNHGNITYDQIISIYSEADF